MELQSVNTLNRKDTLGKSKVKKNNTKLTSIIQDDEDESENLKKIIQKANLMIIEKEFDLGFNSLYTKLKAMQQKDKESKWDVDSLEVLLKGYYLLGFCCIKLGKIKKAKDILISAYWKSLKIKEKNNGDEKSNLEDDLTIIRLKAFASLFESEKKLDKTIHEYCQCLYLLASQYGPAHIKCLNLYYSIGCVFLKIKNRQIEAERFLTRFVNTWSDIVILGLTQNTISHVLDQFLKHFQLDFKENLMNLEELSEMYLEFRKTHGNSRTGSDIVSSNLSFQVFKELGGVYFESKLYLVLMVLYWKMKDGLKVARYQNMFNIARKQVASSEWSAFLEDINLNAFYIKITKPNELKN
jgi:hypothetical protein